MNQNSDDLPDQNPYRSKDGNIKIQERASSMHDPDLQPYEDKLKAIVDDQALADDLYNQLPEAKGGKVIGTNIARELLDEYAVSREGKIEFTNATGRVAQAYAKDRLYREINRRGDRQNLLFTAGGVAAGKSFILNADMVNAVDLVFDGTLRESHWAIPTIQNAINKGWKVAIKYVQRPIELAIHDAIFRANETGKHGPLADVPATHKAAQESIIKIAKHFDSNPNVKISFLLNDGTKVIPREPIELTLEDIDEGGAHSYAY